MPRLLPRVLTEQDLPAAELSALRLRGELYPLGDVFCPVDDPETLELRCAALGAASEPGLIVESWSAAWLWGAVDADVFPSRFCVDVRRRRHAKHRRQIRSVVIDPDEWVMRHGVAITSPARTASDLARDADAADAVAVAALIRLIACGRTSEAEIRAQFRRHPGQAGTPLAERRLRSVSAVVDAVDVVDGVDAADRVEHAVQVGRVAHLEHEPAERQAVA